jgi:pyruvate/oxaloacetate carboxyltransferase
MENKLETLQKELEEFKKLYREAKQSELMYQNIVRFLLYNEVPESTLSNLRKKLKTS